MKHYLNFIGLAFLLVFSSCRKETKSDIALNEDDLVNAVKPQSIVKDSFTYYNGLQKNIDVDYGKYFGFVFEADGQELEWEMESAIDPNIAYIAESYEPEVDTEEAKGNGKHYFTFHALYKGKAKVKFKAKNSKDVRTIHITIK